MKAKMIFLIALSFSSSQVMAEGKTIDQMLSSVKLEKMQATVMINRLFQSGRVSADEAQRMKREIASVETESEKEIKAKALENLNSSKSFATK